MIQICHKKPGVELWFSGSEWEFLYIRVLVELLVCMYAILSVVPLLFV